MDNMPLRDVTEEEIETYWEDGAVHLPNIISMDWIERMRVALDRVLAKPGRFGSDLNLPGTEGRFAFESFMWTYDDDFRALALESPLAPITAQIMRAKKVNFVFDFIFAKEPHSPHPTLWHQDQAGNPVHGRQVAGTWVPLDVVTHDSGAVEYIKGSHNWNRWFAIEVDEESNRDVEELLPESFEVTQPGDDTDGGIEARIERYDEKFEPQPDFEKMREQYEIISFDSEPGDVVLNHLLVVHHAPGNFTDRRRRALGARWAGETATFARREGAFTATLPWDPGLKDGDPFPPDHSMFPQVWPRIAKAKKTKAAE